MFNFVSFPSSLTTVPFSCPIMEATWTWSLRWQSRKMNWRDFRRKEGKIIITAVSVSLFAFPSLSPNFKSKRSHVHNVLKWKTFSNTSLKSVNIVCTSKVAFGICARTAHKRDWQVDNVIYLPNSDCLEIKYAGCGGPISCYEKKALFKSNWCFWLKQYVFLKQPK